MWRAPNCKSTDNDYPFTYYHWLYTTVLSTSGALGVGYCEDERVVACCGY